MHFIFAVPKLKRRWKNLKDAFRRIFKIKNPVLKSGAAAEEAEFPDSDEKDTKWKYYDRLMFLKDTVTSRK